MASCSVQGGGVLPGGMRPSQRPRRALRHHPPRGFSSLFFYWILLARSRAVAIFAFFFCLVVSGVAGVTCDDPVGVVLGYKTQ